jgi:integrase
MRMSEGTGSQAQAATLLLSRARGAGVQPAASGQQQHHPQNHAEFQLEEHTARRTEAETGKARRAIFFEDASEALHRWSEFSGKAWIERSSLARNLKNASKKAFPNQPEKWICVHDLRHSYAIRLIRDYEFNLTQTAMFMGNSVVFREEHYANFVMSDENIESLYRAKVKKPSSALP